MSDPQELVASPAALRFLAFFQELGRVFVERDDLLRQIGLALLAREHVLMTGPPGTAKSAIASAVLGRIDDERTGAPSVFARQFTESTVQTDLIGPVDFKTLMQSGRTEHFTDEGMLGAVHAFLDEVLDGRDMLLRTTLNVLQERELKQGNVTKKGVIECALMTTNRYIAEVLEGSRETLLAFVDRIAFISFVPKGFAEGSNFAKVLRTQIGGVRRPRLDAVLTIQDLDVLQAAADDVFVPDEVCDAMGALLSGLEEELSAAARGDSSFVATRYLSTRTAVRLGRVLRAAVIHRRITEGGPEEATFADLQMLRYSLLLCGPSREAVNELLGHETDVRERRQLSIMRTEWNIFDSVLGRLVKKYEKYERKARSRIDVPALEREVAQNKAEPRLETLVATAAKLAKAADAGGQGAQRAASFLADTLDTLGARALELGLSGGAGTSPAGDVVSELRTLAQNLENAPGTTRPIARWLRGRAMAILEENASLGFAKMGAWLDNPLPEGAGIDDAAARADSMLKALEQVAAEHARLRAEGAEEPARAEGSPPPLARAAARLEDELVVVWDAALQGSVRAALEAKTDDRLGAVLDALGPHLENVDLTGQRLEALGAAPRAFKSRVLGPRIRPLLEAAFERLDASDRLALIERASSLIARLTAVGLGHVLGADELLALTVRVLLRTESVRTREEPPSFEGYRALRASEQRVSLTYTLLATAFRVSRQGDVPSTDHDARISALRGLLDRIPDALREEVAVRDAARIERAVTLLERFWARQRGRIEEACASTDPAAVRTALHGVRTDRFFHVTRDEGALARFSLEARLLAEVFRQRARGERTFYHFIDDEELAAMASGQRLGPSLHVEPAPLDRSPQDCAAKLEREIGPLLDDLSQLARARDKAMLSDLDPAADVGTEGQRARAEAFYKDRAALERRYARWFPSAPTPCEREEDDDEEAVFVALSAVAEVIGVVGGLELERRADAVMLLERLLPDGHLTPARYAQVVACPSARVASALTALHVAVDAPPTAN